MSEQLRLRISPCPNDTFMFDALLNGRIPTQGLAFEVGFQDIEELNAGVAAPDGPDISKISYAVLPAIADRYTLLDSGSALGRGNGQLLVRRRGDRSPIQRVAIPGELTTANAMLRRFFPAIVDRTPMLFSEIAAAVAGGAFDAGVLIHEGRFTYERHGLELVADLGALWERQTGLPLPLGAIVARRDLPEEVRRTFDRVLHESIAYAFAHPAVSRPFVREHARELDDEVIDRHIALFVNRHSLSLGEEGRRAVRELTGLPDLHPGR
ncbi:1,4-dihydroxy-6-naphthoate synthase [Alistipes sp.]|uniref:1,4-dihydroxy-6-naphthoate synthase n=1 Tax=Alistipes sp. TaxID=1872444 RepID=UPI003A8B1D1D